MDRNEDTVRPQSTDSEEQPSITASVWALRLKHYAVTALQLAGFGLIAVGAYGFFYTAIATQWVAQTGSPPPRPPLHMLTPMLNLGVAVAGMGLVYVTTGRLL